MHFRFNQSDIPKKNREVPIGMIGAIPAELRRNLLGTMVICTPYAEFELRESEETEFGINRKMEEVVKFFIKYHPELLQMR